MRISIKKLEKKFANLRNENKISKNIEIFQKLIKDFQIWVVHQKTSILTFID